MKEEDSVFARHVNQKKWATRPADFDRSQAVIRQRATAFPIFLEGRNERLFRSLFLWEIRFLKRSKVWSEMTCAEEGFGKEKNVGRRGA